jgi:uncharacterized phage protein (TIGR02220 family)
MKNKLRNKIKDNFTIIPNDLILDQSLSDRSRFIYALLASKPDGWTFYNKSLAKEAGYTVDTLRKYITELVDVGWISKTGQDRVDGKFTSNDYELHATKTTVSVKDGHGKKPSRENPDTYKEAPTVTSTLEKEVSEKICVTDKTDDLIDYLNVASNSRFRHSTASRKPIGARLTEGATVEDVRLVIDYKCACWLGDPEWEGYLNPETLCRPTKFERNLNAAIKWHEDGRPPLNDKAKQVISQQEHDERDARDLKWAEAE